MHSAERMFGYTKDGVVGRLLPVELTVTRIPDADPPLFAGFLRDQSAGEPARST